VTTRRTTFAEFQRILKQLTFLPGADRLGEEAWATYYQLLCGYYPKELGRAVKAVLTSPSTVYFPAPGRLMGVMDSHRCSLGRDWDTVRISLEMEEKGQVVSGYIDPAEDRSALESAADEFLEELGGDAKRIGRLPKTERSRGGTRE